MKTKIYELEDLVENYYNEFKNISTNQFDHKPSPDKWSKKEILGHLVDSAQNNIQRFIRCQYSDTPSISYDQDEWVRLNNYQMADLKQLIELWYLLNLRLARIWKYLPEENLKKTCDIKGQVINIEWLVDDYIRHLKHHLGQIVEL